MDTKNRAARLARPTGGPLDPVVSILRLLSQLMALLPTPKLINEGVTATGREGPMQRETDAARRGWVYDVIFETGRRPFAPQVEVQWESIHS